MAGFAQRFGVTVATVLFMASCGNSGVGDDALSTLEPEQTSVPETSTTAQPATTTTLASVDPEGWVDAVNEKIEDQYYAGTIADLRYTLLQQDNQFFHITFDATFWRELAAAQVAFAEALPEPPTEFADLAGAYGEASLALAERWAVAADDLDADAEAEALENYELPEDWDTYIEANSEAAEAVTAACFALRDAVIDSDFGLINCIGGTDPGETVWRTPEDCRLAERAFGFDPCSEADGDSTTVDSGESELDAGATYTFNTFAQPFALTIDEPTQVNVQDSLVEISPIDSDLWSMFWIMAVDEIADPATIADDPLGLGPLIDMPDDFGEWVEGLPFEVASEGQSTFGDATAPYWRLEAPAAPAAPGPPDWYQFTPTGPPLGRGGMFWLLPHPDGPLVVYTLPFADEPLAPDSR